MTTKRLVIVLGTLIAVFMIGTVAVALWQEDFNWGWWWAVPVGGVFLLAIIGFRVLVQRSEEAAHTADRDADQ